MGITALLSFLRNEDRSKARAFSPCEALEVTLKNVLSLISILGGDREAACLDGSERQPCEIPSVCSVQFKNVMISMTLLFSISHLRQEDSLSEKCVHISEGDITKPTLRSRHAALPFLQEKSAEHKIRIIWRRLAVLYGHLAVLLGLVLQRGLDLPAETSCAQTAARAPTTIEKI